jgi:TRAP-type C4-dicarboxylate transport system permease small subunit
MNKATHLPAGRAAGPVATAIGLLDQGIVAICALLSVTALVVMFGTLMLEVGVRYATSQGLGWPTEMPSLLFPWLVMSGIVLAAQRGQHIAVTALLDQLPAGGKRALLLALQVLIAVTFFYLAWVGLDVLEITGSEEYPVTGITAKWAYLALVAGFVGLGLTALTTLGRLLLAEDPTTVRAHSVEEEL